MAANSGYMPLILLILAAGIIGSAIEAIVQNHRRRGRRRK